MAASFLSTPSIFHSSTPSSCSSCSSSSSSSSSPLVISKFWHNNTKPLQICKANNDPPLQIPTLTKRTLSISFISSLIFPLVGQEGFYEANGAILEADDDEELLEKVKADRKKRLQRQGVISSANQQTAYLQEVVYKLSKVGQAIDNNDFLAANSVLGGSSDADWVRNANLAFTKLSSSSEEKSEADAFKSSLASLISSVTQNDVESSKTAFVESASALEKWTALAGLGGQLKGL